MRACFFYFAMTLCLLGASSSLTALHGQTPETDAAAQSPALENVASERPRIGYTDALVLGLVEGITEYLPVSSTGHLILANRMLGLDQDLPLTDSFGNIIEIQLDEPTADGATTRPFFLSDAANAYAIIIQAGAIAAVVILYWQRLLGILMGVLGKNPNGLRLAINLLLAFLPAAVLGLLLDDWIESKLFGNGPVMIALFVGGVLMLAVDRWQKSRGRAPDAGPDLHELSPRACLTIGFLQCIAMWPGTSRSMMTIVGGYLVGLSPQRAAEFSFLLGLITLSAASGYKCVQSGSEMLRGLELGPVLFGIFVATISAALAVKWLVNYLNKHGLAIFGWYRILLVGLLLAFL